MVNMEGSKTFKSIGKTILTCLRKPFKKKQYLQNNLKEKEDESNLKKEPQQEHVKNILTEDISVIGQESEQEEDDDVFANFKKLAITDNTDDEVFKESNNESTENHDDDSEDENFTKIVKRNDSGCDCAYDEISKDLEALCLDNKKPKKIVCVSRGPVKPKKFSGIPWDPYSTQQQVNPNAMCGGAVTTIRPESEENIQTLMAQLCDELSEEFKKAIDNDLQIYAPEEYNQTNQLIVDANYKFNDVEQVQNHDTENYHVINEFQDPNPVVVDNHLQLYNTDQSFQGILGYQEENSKQIFPYVSDTNFENNQYSQAMLFDQNNSVAVGIGSDYDELSNATAIIEPVLNSDCPGITQVTYDGYGMSSFPSGTSPFDPNFEIPNNSFKSPISSSLSGTSPIDPNFDYQNSSSKSPISSSLSGTSPFDPNFEIPNNSFKSPISSSLSGTSPIDPNFDYQNSSSKSPISSSLSGTSPNYSSSYQGSPSNVPDTSTSNYTQACSQLEYQGKSMYNNYYRITATSTSLSPGGLNNSNENIVEIPSPITSEVGIQKKSMPKFKKDMSEIKNNFNNKLCCIKTDGRNLSTTFSQLNDINKTHIINISNTADLKATKDFILRSMKDLYSGEAENYHIGIIFYLGEKLMSHNMEEYLGEFGMAALRLSVLWCYKHPTVAYYIVKNIYGAYQGLQRTSKHPIFDEIDKNGDNLIVFCARAGDTYAEVLAALCDPRHNCPPLLDLYHYNYEGYNALHMACMLHSKAEPRLHVVHVLLHHAQIDVFKESLRGGEISLHLAVNSSTCDIDLILLHFYGLQKEERHRLANYKTKHRSLITPKAMAKNRKTPGYPEEVWLFLDKCR